MLDNFTYGFELEGVFSNALLSHTNIDDYKHDGSVDIRYLLIPREKLIESDRGYLYTEYASPIFLSLPDMLEHLRLFYVNFLTPDAVYENNDSCGLHIHIKENTATRSQQANIFTTKHLTAIRQWTLDNMGEKQKRRLDSNRYCRPYSTAAKNTLYNVKNQDKYRIVRNHPSGTAEFRLFSPELENTPDIIEQFFKFLHTDILLDEPKLTYSVKQPTAQTIKSFITSSPICASSLSLSTKENTINLSSMIQSRQNTSIIMTV